MTRSGVDRVKTCGELDGASVAPRSSFILNSGGRALAASECRQFTLVYRCWKTDDENRATYCHSSRSTVGHRRRGTSLRKSNRSQVIGTDLCVRPRLKNPVALIASKLPLRISAVVHYPPLRLIPRFSLPVLFGCVGVTLA